MAWDIKALTDLQVWRREVLKLLDVSGGGGGGGGLTQQQTTDAVEAGVIAAAPTWQLTQTFESATSGVVKATPGALGSAIATNEHTADQYLQFFDSATAPAEGAVPKLWLKIPAGGSYTVEQNLWGDRGLAFQSGIAWGISSTRKTFTAGDSSVDVQIYWV